MHRNFGLCPYTIDKGCTVKYNYDTAPYCIFEGYVSVSYFVGRKDIKKPHQSKMMKLRMTGFEC